MIWARRCPNMGTLRPDKGVFMSPDVFVDLAAAIICFATTCHPVLVGPVTPRGEFQIIHYRTPIKIYRGDFLAFKETRDSLYTIHRVVNVPGQERLARLKSPDPKRRTGITGEMHQCRASCL